MPNSETESFTERFERGVVRAASHLKHFIDERADVRLILGAEAGPYGSGLEHLYQCLRRLAVVAPESQASSSGPLSDFTGAEESMGADTHLGEDYAIVLTTAQPGSIPTKIWRSSYVIYL